MAQVKGFEPGSSNVHVRRRTSVYCFSITTDVSKLHVKVEKDASDATDYENDDVDNDDDDDDDDANDADDEDADEDEMETLSLPGTKKK